MGVTTVARVCSWCPSKTQADAWAIAQGHEISHGMCPACEAKFMADLEEFERPAVPARQPGSIRADFGTIAPLDKVAKAELYMRYYGWKHCQSGDGPDCLPCVDDMARVVELVCNRHMSWKEAMTYLLFEKSQAPNTSPGFARDESWRAQAAQSASQLDAEEQAHVK